VIAIIGAGLAGMSVAVNLRPPEYRIFDREQSPGGLCRSHVMDGFTFDFTGHLLHLKTPDARRMVGSLLDGRLVKIKRNAAVYRRGRYVPYPFQAHLFNLPTRVARACLAGFLNAARRRDPSVRHPDFKRWVTAWFGSGIARHFFIPYNKKLWCRDLRLLTASWADWSVPRPTVQEVLRGVLGVPNAGMGYNATFYYPAAGGIGVLAKALAEKVPDLETGSCVRAVNLGCRTLTLAGGKTVGYSRLIATLPLPALLRMIEDAPAWLRTAASRLSAVAVHNINIGVNRPRITPHHWIYFPDPDMPFYRVGCYSNFTPAMAPRGASSLYVEIAAPDAARLDPEALFEASLEGLRRCGILRSSDRIVARHDATIPCAYVVFDKRRERLLPRIRAYLAAHNVTLAGRYGAWTYASMQDALLEGRRIARDVRNTLRL